MSTWDYFMSWFAEVPTWQVFLVSFAASFMLIIVPALISVICVLDRRGLKPWLPYEGRCRRRARKRASSRDAASGNAVAIAGELPDLEAQATSIVPVAPGRSPSPQARVSTDCVAEVARRGNDAPGCADSALASAVLPLPLLACDEPSSPHMTAVPTDHVAEESRHSEDTMINTVPSLPRPAMAQSAESATNVVFLTDCEAEDLPQSDRAPETAETTAAAAASEPPSPPAAPAEICSPTSHPPVSPLGPPASERRESKPVLARCFRPPDASLETLPVDRATLPSSAAAVVRSNGAAVEPLRLEVVDGTKRFDYLCEGCGKLGHVECAHEGGRFVLSELQACCGACGFETVVEPFRSAEYCCPNCRAWRQVQLPARSLPLDCYHGPHVTCRGCGFAGKVAAGRLMNVVCSGCRAGGRELCDVWMEDGQSGMRHCESCEEVERTCRFWMDE